MNIWAKAAGFEFRIRFVLGVTLVAVGSVAAAQTRLQSAQQAIVSTLRAGKYVSSLDMLAEAIKRQPRDPGLWALKGFAFSHLGKTSQALASYKHAIELSPDYLPALEGEAQIEYNTSNRNAVTVLKKILSLRPKDETSHAMLAALAFEQGDCKTAAGEFQQSGSLISSRVAPLEEYGACLVRLGRPSDAIEAFRKLKDLQPLSGRAAYNLGLVELLAKRYQGAIITLSSLVRQNPHDADALDLLGEGYEGALDTPKAVATLRKAIVTDPDVPRYYLDFADLCIVHDAYQIGVDMLNAGLRRLPDSAQIYVARGILYVQLGKYAESDRDFAKADRLDPNLQHGAALQSLAALQQNNLPQAEKVIRGRLQKMPNNAFLRYLLGETLTREGASVGGTRFNEALQSARKAIQLQPNFSQARDLLGRLLLEQGKTNEAIRESRLAFQEDPADQAALYHLILALRRGGNQREIAPLVKQLAKLRERARMKKAAEH
ncbi:MAG: tetratricopeptide repeat protein, partial [Terriglobia bacterium]